jgi:hypothetical protein
MNEIIGIITVIVAVGTYIPYLIDTIRGKVTPHPFTWIIWVTLTTVAYIAQLSDNAGPGAWMNAPVILICFAIVILSIKNGFHNVTKFDLSIFSLGIVAIVTWAVTDSPFYSVILVCIANTLAYIPTFLKSYKKPNEEAIYLYGINFFRHGASIFALTNISLITALFPIVLTINNGLLALFLLWRRNLK